MVTQELINYIRQKQENGISKIQIEQALTSKGWSKDDIKKGFYAYKLLISPDPKSFVSKKKTSGFGKIFFIFLLIITLSFTLYYLSTETVYLDSVKPLIIKIVNLLPLPKKSTTSVLTYPTPSPDIRQELSSEEWSSKFDQNYSEDNECGYTPNFNFSKESDTFITYTSQKYNYSIDLPYSHSWGDDQNKLKPYEIIESNDGINKIYFNHFRQYDSCSIFRSHYEELPPTAINEAIDEINKQNEEHRNDPIYETITYEEILDLKYPVLKIINPEKIIGTQVSYKVFLSNLTLNFPYLISPGENDYFIDLVSTIKEI